MDDRGDARLDGHLVVARRTLAVGAGRKTVSTAAWRV